MKKQLKLHFPFKKKTGLDFNRRRPGRNHRNMRPVVKAACSVAAAALGGFLVAFLFFSGVGVNGESMSPTLEDGNRVFINRAGLLANPKVGDIVAFLPDGSNDRSVSIKRVIALPGDSVLIENGSLYVNGERDRSGFESIAIANPGMARNELMLGEDEFFLLGDNRNNSEDSRFESVGNVKKSDIIGLVWFCYSPDHFGPIG